MSSDPQAAIIYLASIDETPNAPHVVKTAAGLAHGLPGPAELHVLHVVTMPTAAESVPTFLSASELLERGRSFVDRACADAAFEGRVVGHLAMGEPWREIVGMAERLNADLLVIGTTDQAPLRRLILGSVAEKVVRYAECPVLVSRPKDYQRGHKPTVPEIEPPCPECLEAQRTSDGERLWCSQHAMRHPHGRLHYEMPQGYGAGAMLIRP
jgi:nucleotide-binding universal stress UspA family protein